MLYNKTSLGLVKDAMPAIALARSYGNRSEVLCIVDSDAPVAMRSSTTVHSDLGSSSGVLSGVLEEAI